MKVSWKTVVSTAYFMAGIVIVLATQVVGCVGTKVVEVTDIDIERVSDKDKALNWYKQELLKVNVEGLAVEQNLPEKDQNQRVLAELHFNICADAAVYYHCDLAVEKYSEIVDANPNDWQSRAYLGSSYALKARDYPVQGLWQVIPGPGFVRLYFLNRSVHHLNAAVEANPNDPVIRLIRGSTFIGLPGESSNGKKDFDLLLDWIENPRKNPAYEDILQSEMYSNGVYYSYAVHRDYKGKPLSDSEALKYWNAIIESGADYHPMFKVATIYTADQ